jgi:ABC-type phosphate transport system substrate-binding protein
LFFEQKGMIQPETNVMKSFIVTLLWFLACTEIAAAQVAVIVHKDAPIDTLDQAQIRDMYCYDVTTWSNKVPVTIFDLKLQSEVREAFYKFLGRTSSRMKSIWLKKLLMGEGNPPEALKSEEDMVKKVGATPGAIGFVSQAKVNSSVKVVMVIHKSEK